MKEPKDVVLTIDGKALTMELDLKDEDLIELPRECHGSVREEGLPDKGLPGLWPLSFISSTTIVSKIMSKVEQVVEWRDELKKVNSSQRGKL